MTTNPNQPRQIRVHRDIWAAYENLCARLGTTRGDRINQHIRADIALHGTPQEQAAAADADQEMAERKTQRIKHTRES
ncbi:hypothetical protein EMG21_28540 [Klebsiella pneumoniae]|nr:hypothetical protein EMG21_28540 [Klebsiella pneumoniae]